MWPRPLRTALLGRKGEIRPARGGSALGHTHTPTRASPTARVQLRTYFFPRQQRPSPPVADAPRLHRTRRQGGTAGQVASRRPVQSGEVDATGWWPKQQRPIARLHHGSPLQRPGSKCKKGSRACVIRQDEMRTVPWVDSEWICTGPVGSCHTYRPWVSSARRRPSATLPRLRAVRVAHQ